MINLALCWLLCQCYSNHYRSARKRHHFLNTKLIWSLVANNRAGSQYKDRDCANTCLWLSADCLKETWAGRKGDTAGIAEDKKKKKGKKKKGKDSEDGQKKEKKVKKKKKEKSKLHNTKKRKTEEAGYTSDEEDIQKKVPLNQEKTELWYSSLPFLFVFWCLTPWHLKLQLIPRCTLSFKSMRRR